MLRGVLITSLFPNKGVVLGSVEVDFEGLRQSLSFHDHDRAAFYYTTEA